MRSTALLLAGLWLSLLALPSAHAQTPGTCQTGGAQRDLDASGVRATLRNTGALFHNDATAGLYEVPLGSGVSPIYTAGLWIGGQRDDGLHLAGARYDNFEFWPGPLDADGMLPDGDCSAYDRIWVVNALDIAAFEAGDGATPDLAEWPVLLGAPVMAAPANGFDDDGDGLTDEGTDEIDNDGDGAVDEHDEQELVNVEVRITAGLSPYDLSAGDRPEVLGTQTAFWVMNDVGNAHTETGTPPIGLEVRVSAFAIATEDPTLYYATFYRYSFVKKTPGYLDDTFVSFFLDADVGDGGDDYVGTDQARSLAFAYNADPTDNVYGLPPAVGLDVYQAVVDSDQDGEVDDILPATSVMYFNNVGDLPTGDPDTGAEYYNVMRGLWADGSPLSAEGNGYQTGGPVVPFAFPGDPVAGEFWSEVNAYTDGGSTTPGDRRLVVSVGSFDMEPHEVHTLDFGLLFAQGDDHLNSVAELRAASDAAQARYENGTLFVPFETPPPVPLGSPALVAPADGTVFTDAPPMLEWTDVPDAVRYRVELSTTPDFQSPTTRFTLIPELVLTNKDFPSNEIATYFWRVRAESLSSTSLFSPTRSFTFYRYAFEEFDYGTGIIEIANPFVSPCPDPGDPGCESFGGNTIWLSPNATEDYVVTSPNNSLDRMIHAEAIGGDDFEMRFTEDCLAFGACLGAYIRDGESIVSVPFELWNIREADDDTDDVRMIPMIRPHSGTEPLADWANTFSSFQAVPVTGTEMDLEVTDRVFWLMPDRPDGYALFEAAANGFGGPGAIYERDNDGDDQIDLNADGNECARQDYYVDFCYRSLAPYRAPIGGSSSGGLLFADFAGDGTTPPPGTTIRLVSNDILLVGTDDEAPLPSTFSITAAYPNPFRAQATVDYTLSTPSEARLSLYDLLGRRVAVLAEGLQPAGTHRARIDGGRLASGVYVVVLEAEGGWHARRLLLVR